MFVTPRPHVDQIEWKTREPSPPGEHRNRGYAGKREWRPKPLQPVNRTLGEAVLSGRNIRPSGPIPDSGRGPTGLMEPIPDSHSMEVELEEVEQIREKLEKHEKRLVVIVTSLERVEERVDGKVRELDAKTENLNSKLNSFSTLISQMEKLLEYYDARKFRR